jgi:DNA-binding NtrC family response regulator
VYPLGATAPEVVDVRVVSATHRNLKRLEQEEKFRSDLFARLNEYELKLPPLRERKEDVYLLFRTFLSRHGGAHLDVSFLLMAALLHHDFPYNVRELEACAKRAIALAEGTVLDAPLLPESIRDEMAEYGRAAPAQRESQDEDDMPRHGAPSEADLRSLLEQHQGNVAAVGRALGKARMQIHRWVERYGIALDDYRAPPPSSSPP